MFLGFSSFPPDSVLSPEFLIIFFVFIPYHPKEFQFFRCLQLSRVLGMSSESSTMLLVASVMGRLEGGFRRSWEFAKRAARGGAGSSKASEPFDTFTPTEFFSLLGSWSFRTRIPQRTLAKLYGTMCGILDSFRQVRAPPSPWAELKVPLEAAVRDGDVILADDREANKAWCEDRQELFLHLTSQLLQDKHTWTHRPGLQERDVCTLLLTKSILGLPGWIRAGYRGVGDIRPACLFPLVKSKCFLESGVRRCCKVGQSCMRRVIDCSSIPHKMAWRSVARVVDPGAKFLTFYN